MSATAGRMVTCKNANEMPTASASMLVATASSSSPVTKLRPLSHVSSSPPRNVSTTILPPMNNSSANTIQ